MGESKGDLKTWRLTGAPVGGPPSPGTLADAAAPTPGRGALRPPPITYGAEGGAQDPGPLEDGPQDPGPGGQAPGSDDETPHLSGLSGLAWSGLFSNCTKSSSCNVLS